MLNFLKYTCYSSVFEFIPIYSFDTIIIGILKFIFQIKMYGNTTDFVC